MRFEPLTLGETRGPVSVYYGPKGLRGCAILLDEDGKRDVQAWAARDALAEALEGFVED